MRIYKNNPFLQNELPAPLAAGFNLQNLPLPLTADSRKLIAAANEG
jgi:hypothetical protein